MLIRAEVFAKVGFMDERYFVYGDDTVFVCRAREAAFCLRYTPATVLFHKVSTLTGGTKSDFTIWWSTRARGLFIAKHFAGLEGSMARLMFRMYMLTRMVAGSDSLEIYKKRVMAFDEGIEVIEGY